MPYRFPALQQDALTTCIEVYGDNWQAYYAVAEIAYAQQYRQIPEWGIFIERIERYADGDVIIHRDPKAIA